jgi:hypothetical protein
MRRVSTKKVVVWPVIKETAQSSLSLSHLSQLISRSTVYKVGIWDFGVGQGLSHVGLLTVP